MGCNGSKAAAPAAAAAAPKPCSGERVAETLLEKRSAGPPVSADKKFDAVSAPEVAPGPENASGADLTATQEAGSQEIISVLLPEEIEVITSETAPNEARQSPGQTPGASLSERHGSAPTSQTEDAGLDISRERVARDAHAASKKEERQQVVPPKMWLPGNAITGLASHIGNIEASGADVVLSKTTERPSSISASGRSILALCNPCCAQAVDTHEETVMIPMEIPVQTHVF